MQFVVCNVAKAELDSTSATDAQNVARKVPPCFRDLRGVGTYAYPSSKGVSLENK